MNRKSRLALVLGFCALLLGSCDSSYVSTSVGVSYGVGYGYGYPGYYPRGGFGPPYYYRPPVHRPPVSRPPPVQLPARPASGIRR